MVSKEDILLRTLDDHREIYDIEKAMDEWAKIIAIGFANHAFRKLVADNMLDAAVGINSITIDEQLFQSYLQTLQP